MITIFFFNIIKVSVKGWEGSGLVEQEYSGHKDYANERVPMNERKSTWSVALVASGFCIAMSGLFTGAAMAAGLGIFEAVFSAIIGNIILGIFGGAIGIMGAREGYSTARLAIFSYGNKGFKLVSLALAVTMGGWFAWQNGFFGETIHALFPEGGFITNPPVAAFWGGILMLTTAYFGYKGLDILSKFAVPAIVIISSIGVFTAINYIGGWSALAKVAGDGNLTFSAGIVMVVGSFAAGASSQADITRYAKNGKSALYATLFGYLGANSFVILAGYLMSLTKIGNSLPAAMLSLGLGVFGLLVLILAQWTTNDNNLYTSSLGLATIFPNVKKSTLVVIIGIVGSVVASLGITGYFVKWLVILGVAIPPMAGILAVDYFVLHKGSYTDVNSEDVPDWNWNAILSWIIAATIGYYLKLGIQSINSLILAGALYFTISKINLKMANGG